MPWRRLRRRTFAPRRPIVFPEQWGLLLVTALAIGVSFLFLAKALL